MSSNPFTYIKGTVAYKRFLTLTYSLINSTIWMIVNVKLAGPSKSLCSNFTVSLPYRRGQWHRKFPQHLCNELLYSRQASLMNNNPNTPIMPLQIIIQLWIKQESELGHSEQYWEKGTC